MVRRLTEAFEREGFAHALVGAFARNAWGRVRTTTDVDFAIAVDAATLDRLRALLAAAGLRVRREVRTYGPVPELLLLFAEDDPDLKVDLLVAHTPFEKSVIERRVFVETPRLSAWVASPEDVLVYKLVAGRSRDWADVEEVTRTQTAAGRPIDWDYVRRFAGDFGVAERVDDCRRRLGV
jgi:hypothetical protein